MHGFDKHGIELLRFYGLLEAVEDLLKTDGVINAYYYQSWQCTRFIKKIALSGIGWRRFKDVLKAGGGT